MKICFGATQAPKGAAAALAARLSGTMDRRSKPALLLIAVEHSDIKRRVTMLLLPRSAGVSLSQSREDIVIRALRNIFSVGSSFRKAARLEGHEHASQFLSAHILDLQLANADKNVADFWVKDFLQARPGLASDAGTKRLAAALRRAFEASPEDQRDAVFGAMHKAGSGMVKKTSLQKFANEIPAEAHKAYFRGVEANERNAVFDVNAAILKNGLGRRVIVTKEGTYISAPESVVGKSVKMENGPGGRIVSLRDRVDTEKVTKAKKPKKAMEPEKVEPENPSGDQE